MISTCRTVPAWSCWTRCEPQTRSCLLLWHLVTTREDYEQEAKRRGATLCMDKMKGLLLQDKLVEYAYRQLSGEKAPTFHKLLFVHAEDTNAGVLRAAMLQKGFDLILIPSIAEAKRRIFEDKK